MSTSFASELDAASRSDLIARAEALGVDKADVLTRAELVDEIVKRTIADPIERRLARGLLGVARDLVARVVERGLHLPDAAALIRGLQQVAITPVTPPIATVTLADIYAGQGHRARALAVLDEVLEKEPEHAAARALRERIAGLAQEEVTARPSSEPPADIAPSTELRPGVLRELEDARQVEDAREVDNGAADFAANRAPSAVEGELDGPATLVPDEVEPDSESSRDTLPPATDLSPTLTPANLPLASWQVAPPEDDFEPPTPARPRSVEIASLERAEVELEPAFGVRRDDVVLVPVDATSALARWELGTAALEGARARSRGGELILRIVAVTPSWDGPRVEIRDIEVADPLGDWWVCDLPAGAVLRAAIGWRDERGFDPLAVALDIAASRGGDEATRERFGAGESDDEARRRAGIEERARQRAEQGRPSEGRALSSWRTLALARWETPYEAQPASFETH